MKENITEKLSLNEIATALGYSTSRFSAIFKQETNNSVINYFIELKIQKACELLSTKELSITQVGEYLNFDTPQYFSAQFKKIMNLTPSQFVQELKLQGNDLSIIFDKVGEWKNQ